MSKVFGKNTTPPNQPNRNTFDLSRQVNTTLDYGQLIPIVVDPVIPGDSFEYDLAFGLRAMPTAFPIQTKVRVDTHFFYVRNRNLWKDWVNFIGKTGADNYVLPYTQSQFNPLRTCELADYLGMPTTLFNVTTLSRNFLLRGESKLVYDPLGLPSGDIYSSAQAVVMPSGSGFVYDEKLNYPTCSPGLEFSFTGVFFDPQGFQLLYNSGNYVARLFGVSEDNRGTFYALPFDAGEFQYSYDSSGNPLPEFTIKFHCVDTSSMQPCAILFFKKADRGRGYHLMSAQDLNQTSFPVSVSVSSGASPTDFADNSASQYLNFNALPFRAYESIYNSFYRDQRNNPYIIDGVNDPNRYLPTQEGGLDDNYYPIRYRNWEQDFITSCVPSPQQGTAPLVGITSSGVATFANDDGSTTTVDLSVADDGDTITGATYHSNIPNSVARSIVDIASSGISISDFRGVNALQRWLEINMRRGLKYKDQILSHFGVETSFAELDMPEFLGGATQYLDPSQVNQTSSSVDGAPLGSFAGQLSCVGKNNHTIRHYCDEHGYIIGIMSIVPVPAYSQIMPKDFLKSSPLDYFFPEFGHLGMQPVTYAEVCPLQVLAANGGDESELQKTFGYQRAWYDYLARTDEVHGNFRNFLRDFVLYRNFVSIPTLTPDFLTVNKNQLNNIFTVTDVEDPNTGEKVPIHPFLGQIHIRCLAKRPIPKYGIPRLE